MPKDYNNYVYYHSDALDLDYCHAKDGSHIYTADGVRYDRAEIEQIKKLGHIDPQLHLAKKVMDGTITECKRKSIF